MKKVVLIDDHPIFRDGIKQTLAAAKKYSVVHESNSVLSLSSYLKENRDQLSDIYFVIDISLPDGSGFELLPLIAAAGGLTRQCAMLSMHDDYEYAEHAFAQNAYGYVVKSDEQDNIITCLESLENGRHYISPGVKKRDEKDRAQRSSHRRVRRAGARVVSVKQTGGDDSEISGGGKNKQTNFREIVFESAHY